MWATCTLVSIAGGAPYLLVSMSVKLSTPLSTPCTSAVGAAPTEKAQIVGNYLSNGSTFGAVVGGLIGGLHARISQGMQLRRPTTTLQNGRDCEHHVYYPPLTLKKPAQITGIISNDFSMGFY